MLIVRDSNMFCFLLLPMFKRMVAVLFFLCTAFISNAYSILTHEALIDVNWEKVLLPLLKQKYPGSTEKELKEAHAYAYGGAVVPDMGYFPRGSRLFTNLIHYVRSGDFVLALLQDAQNINEYAFALGVLCHYNADKYGHSIGINPGVPMTYPKVEKKFGDTVTYAEDPVAHVRMEFSYDVLQTARGNYAPDTYHDFIGFKVARPLLEKSFLRIYGINVNDLFNDLGRTIGTFRWVVKDLFPVITRAAWASKKGEISKATPGATGRKFIYTMHRKNYNRDFVSKDERPPSFANVWSLLFRIAPKIGPLRVLKFKAPGTVAEKLFIQSFDTTVVFYTYYISELRSGRIVLNNINYDTGIETASGEYKLADKAYVDLLSKLSDQQFNLVTVSLQQNILSFFNGYKPVTTTKRTRKEWLRTEQSLTQLKTIQPIVKQ
jgi:Zinc dependent phospholipase C